MKRLGLTLIGAALLAVSLGAAAGDRGHDRLRDSYHAGHSSSHHKAPGWQRHHHKPAYKSHHRHYHKAPRVEHHHYYHRGPAYYPRGFHSHRHPLPPPHRRGGMNGHISIYF
ncbi:MAG: hypothetical protein RBS88_07465 [Spongiibacteraceae bacterium]|jgi:Ni/Co efflux regulator RcnB|nr:hypothetical protein [Spongiibacteraceae bacterium]